MHLGTCGRRRGREAVWDTNTDHTPSFVATLTDTQHTHFLPSTPYSHMHTCIHKHAHTRTYMHTHKTYALIQAHINTCTHTNMHRHACMHTNTCTHKHAHRGSRTVTGGVAVSDSTTGRFWHCLRHTLAHPPHGVSAEGVAVSTGQGPCRPWCVVRIGPDTETGWVGAGRFPPS